MGNVSCSCFNNKCIFINLLTSNNNIIYNYWVFINHKHHQRLAVLIGELNVLTTQYTCRYTIKNTYVTSMLSNDKGAHNNTFIVHSSFMLHFLADTESILIFVVSAKRKPSNSEGVLMSL